MPCPACASFGYLLYEYTDGSYEQKKCNWCDGFSYVDNSMRKVFERWNQILRIKREAKRCKLVSVTPIAMKG